MPRRTKNPSVTESGWSVLKSLRRAESQPPEDYPEGKVIATAPGAEDEEMAAAADEAARSEKAESVPSVREEVRELSSRFPVPGSSD